MSQLVNALLPGKQSLNYYHCKYPEMILDDGSNDMNNLKTKLNWTLIVVQTSSILIHIILNIRIKAYKHQEPYSQSYFCKFFFL